MLSSLIDFLQTKFPVERVVALLTPLVFAPLSAAAAAWLAIHFPGLPHVSSTTLTALMSSIALTAGAAAYKWLDGRQKWHVLQAGGPIPTAVLEILAKESPHLLEIHPDGVVRVPTLEPTPPAPATHQVAVPIGDVERQAQVYDAQVYDQGAPAGDRAQAADVNPIPEQPAQTVAETPAVIRPPVIRRGEG